MNISTHPENDALKHFVFRAADRMRIDGCANAVAHEGLSLALYCPFEALLDHYVNLLLGRLRQQAPEHRVEVYFPANTDSLLGRFNEVLASQSLHQAVKPSSTENAAQIWLVHDAHSLPDAEIQLLARLIQNFPGANIRAILLMSGTAKVDKSPLSAFGRKILRWDIEAPSEEQAQAALEQARQEGNFNAVQQLVQRIQRQQRPVIDEPLVTPTLPAATVSAPPEKTGKSALQQKIQDFHKRGTSALNSWKALPRQNTRHWMVHNGKLVVGITSALVVSTLIMLWIQPEAFGIKSTPPVTAAPLQSPQLAAVTAEMTAPTSPEKTPPAPAAMAVTPPAPAIEAPEATLPAQAWLQQLDASSFLLQHGTANTYAKALEIQRKYPALKDAQIVSAYRTGEKLAHFVIVSGPFEGSQQGFEASKRPGIPTSWVRPTRSLQAQLKSPI
jgi:hypothetical protein